MWGSPNNETLFRDDDVVYLINAFIVVVEEVVEVYEPE
jgi:hypothetical protein